MRWCWRMRRRVGGDRTRTCIVFRRYIRTCDRAIFTPSEPRIHAATLQAKKMKGIRDGCPSIVEALSRHLAVDLRFIPEPSWTLVPYGIPVSLKSSGSVAQSGPPLLQAQSVRYQASEIQYSSNRAYMVPHLRLEKSGRSYPIRLA